jgi:hypothetical protein
MGNHSDPGIVCQALEFDHVIHDFIIQGIDILYDNECTEKGDNDCHA